MPEGKKPSGMKARHLVVLAALLAAGCQSVAPSVGDAHPYYVVFLRPDPARTPLPLAERERIQAAHMANMLGMAARGIMVAAGPMDDPVATISGIFVLRLPSLDEARRVAALDPTVAEHRNTADVHPWLGPPGIGDAYFQWKRDHPKEEDSMAVHVFCILTRGTGPVVQGDGERLIASLRSGGKLAAAGPFDDASGLAGLLIFKTASVDEARLSIAGDPAIAGGRLSLEFHRWWTADLVLPW